METKKAGLKGAILMALILFIIIGVSMAILKAQHKTPAKEVMMSQFESEGIWIVVENKELNLSKVENCQKLTYENKQYFYQYKNYSVLISTIKGNYGGNLYICDEKPDFEKEKIIPLKSKNTFIGDDTIQKIDNYLLFDLFKLNIFDIRNAEVVKELTIQKGYMSYETSEKNMIDFLEKLYKKNTSEYIRKDAELKELLKYGVEKIDDKATLEEKAEIKKYNNEVDKKYDLATKRINELLIMYKDLYELYLE